MSTDYLAVDLGAESGRVLLGRFDGERMSVEEVHRFPNVPVWVSGAIYWDALRIFQEVKTGLAKGGEAGDISGVAVDSWGVDFALLDGEGELLSNPRNYRDPRTDGMMEQAFRLVPREEIYYKTGIQFMQINTLYQLLAMRDSPLLETADRLLLIPDLLNYWLTGEKVGEFTNVTTTQLYDLHAGDWARDVAGDMQIPGHIFPRIVQPATHLGPLLYEVADETGLAEGTTVTAAASHDTASAVVAVPAEGENFAYISSGTWSLVGVETPGPVLTSEAMHSNFTNEGGFGGKTRFLKNVMGLWLLQECRRQWIREGREFSYEELARLAEDAPSGPLVDPDHPAFLAPGDMASRIKSFCEETGQRPPEEPAAVARCVFESLALKYGHAIEQAEGLTGQTIGTINVVGGGSQNALLCQLTAGAAQLPVVAGPVEATAIGNVMVQAFAQDKVGSLEEMRAVVRDSFEVSTYEPGGDEWSELRERFSLLIDEAHTLNISEGG
ncbi:MAG TPA: rhamnulokinase family protein [Rubrobacter sp.]